MSAVPARVAAKGWCPSAYYPMESGDGLIVRVRPWLARLNGDQVLGLCAAAEAHGNGIIDLTNRANLQIRGVRPAGHGPLLDALKALHLLDDDPAIDARRNVITAPVWKAGDETHEISKSLSARIGDLPELPPKFGFAVDCGEALQLLNASADIRIERGQSGGLILRPDGAPKGLKVAPERAVDQAISLAYWFVETGGADAKRMAAHLAKAELPKDWAEEAPAHAVNPLAPGTHALGAVYGAPFGQIETAALRALIERSGASALRITPWRLFLLEGAEIDETGEFIARVDDPLMRVDACPGLPRCAAATVETRQLARALASQVETRDLARALAGETEGSLHVSGCAKGCARPKSAEVTLVGRGGTFDLVREGLPWDSPAQSGLEPVALLKRGLPS